MIALTRRTTLLAAIALLAALAMSVGAQQAHSASGTTCKLSEHESFPMVPKPTYNLKLTVKGTSCATAKKVMNAFHKCRSKLSTRCSKKVVKTWSCTGKKGDSTTGLFYGSFTCKTGDQRVTSKYEQYTTQ